MAEKSGDEVAWTVLGAADTARAFNIDLDCLRE